MYDIEKEERVLDNLEIYVKYDKPITREQAEETIDFIMELENKIDELAKNQCKENKRLNNIIDKAKKYLKIHGYYDNEIGRIVEELNDDECTELLQILEDNVKEEFEELKEKD